MNIALLFGLIFAPFIWFIWRILRFTDETIGDHSPVYSIQSYLITSRQHFGTFIHLILLLMGFTMMTTTRLLVPEISRQPTVSIVMILPIAIISLVLFFFYFDWQYWKLVRSKKITLDPLTKSIHVSYGTSQVSLTPETIMRIEQRVKYSTSVRDLFGLYEYYIFYPHFTQPVVLSNTYFLFNEFLDRCFSTVPQIRIEHKMPWPPASTPEL